MLQQQDLQFQFCRTDGLIKSIAFMSAKNNYLSIGEPIRSERMEEINQALETVMIK